MAEILSQGEIDALLSALSQGETGTDQNSVKDDDGEQIKFKKYDFRSPQKFSKEHIRSLEMIHEKYARIVSNYLSGQLRRNVKVNIQSVEQITYDEFIHSIQNPTMISVFSMAPLQGTLLLEINPQFTLMILDILLGGTGSVKRSVKEFSDIDKNIMTQIFTDIIASFSVSWEDILEVNPIFESLETNPSYNQILAPNEPVALISFSVQIGKEDTYMNLCLPYLSIEKLLDKLVEQFLFNKHRRDDSKEETNKIMNGLKSVLLELSVELGKTAVRVDDFLELTEGDVIRLNTRSDQPIKVLVEGNESYLGKPGSVGKNVGVELLDIIDKDVNIDE